MEKGLIVGQPAEREIIVFNQPRQAVDKFTTASTSWLEIAELIAKSDKLQVGNIKNMRAVLQSSQVTLELPAAEVPQGAQKIFLFEAKVKSGATKAAKPATTSTYDAMSYNDLRKLLSPKKQELANAGIKLSGSPTRESLVSALETLAGVVVTKTQKTTPSGKVKEVVTKDETVVKVAEAVKKDKEDLSNQPTLENRIESLEIFVADFLTGIISLCSDFGADKLERTKEAISEVFSSPSKKAAYKGKTSFDKNETDLSLLAKEAQSLKL